ncbi:hypothetical protein ACFZDP_19195 [Streptomyces mirabilis]|uniref:hypothetical protein n=1 Tax=Streptomyces mirabilis TaxID=68239 RepID=UPI0036E72267
MLKERDPSAPEPPREIGPFDTKNDGVHQNADLWLNGVHLGFHPYGYTAFDYDLPPHLRHTWLVRSDRGQP